MTWHDEKEGFQNFRYENVYGNVDVNAHATIFPKIEY